MLGSFLAHSTVEHCVAVVDLMTNILLLPLMYRETQCLGASSFLYTVIPDILVLAAFDMP